MKVIFLDIDGVLNTGSHRRVVQKAWKNGTGNSKDAFGFLFDPECVENLEEIVRQTGAKVVISSSWRLSGLRAMQLLFSYRAIDIEVIDITIDCSKLTESQLYETVERGYEIQEWIDEHNPERYVIIDDQSDMLISQAPCFVQVDSKVGITKNDAQRCIDILNQNP